MTHTIPAGVVAAALPTLPVSRRRGLPRLVDERGMATVEYAIGIVLVLVTIGLVIASIQMGWFDILVKELVTAFFTSIKAALGLR